MRIGDAGAQACAKTGLPNGAARMPAVNRRRFNIIDLLLLRLDHAVRRTHRVIPNAVRDLSQRQPKVSRCARDDTRPWSTESLHHFPLFISIIVLAMTASSSQGNRIHVSWLTSVM